MVIGDKRRVAVEFELDPDPGGFWLYGKCCFWINENMIGDYSMGTSLGDIFIHIQRHVKYCGERSVDCNNLDSETMFNYFNRAAYNWDGNKYEYSEGEIELVRRCDISIHDEAFDEWKMFLVDCDILTSRIIYSSDEGWNVKEGILVPGEFDSVIKRFYLEIDRLGRKFSPGSWRSEFSSNFSSMNTATKMSAHLRKLPTPGDV